MVNKRNKRVRQKPKVFSRSFPRRKQASDSEHRLKNNESPRQPVSYFKAIPFSDTPHPFPKSISVSERRVSLRTIKSFHCHYFDVKFHIVHKLQSRVRTASRLLNVKTKPYGGRHTTYGRVLVMTAYITCGCACVYACVCKRMILLLLFYQTRLRVWTIVYMYIVVGGRTVKKTWGKKPHGRSWDGAKKKNLLDLSEACRFFFFNFFSLFLSFEPSCSTTIHGEIRKSWLSPSPAPRPPHFGETSVLNTGFFFIHCRTSFPNIVVTVRGHGDVRLSYTYIW